MSHAADPASPPARTLRREAAGFAAVGAIGFAVDAGLTMLIAHSGWLSPVAARLPATAIAIAVTFLLNRRWTFASQGRWFDEFGRYVGISLGGAAVNYAGYALFLLAAGALDLTTRHAAIVFLAVASGSAAAAVFNFLGARYVAFAKRTSGPAAS